MRNWAELEPKTAPLIMVISGLSGAGKDAIITRLKESAPTIEHLITVTTRPKRDREKDNIDYKFITAEEFHQMIEKGRLLEWANVYGNLYGVPREPVEAALEKGRDILIKVDIQGAETLKKTFPHAVLVFLIPSSKEELLSRLQERRTESKADLEVRLKTAEAELEKLPLFDYVVVNRQGKIEHTLEVIKAIFTAEKHRVTPPSSKNQPIS